MTLYLFTLNILLIFLCLSVTKSASFPDRSVTSVEKIEKTLEVVIDFFRKTKDSNIYNLFDDVPKESTNVEKNNANSEMECILKPSNCADLQSMGIKENGIYEVYPRGQKDGNPLSVYCDFQTDGGGWTVFQRRGNFGEPKENFFRQWKDYKIGFGDLNKEFWLGNDKLSLLTNNDRMTLRIDLEDFENTTKYAQYTDFIVKGENELYNMSFTSYSGTAGNSLHYHKGKTFVTVDKDNNSECARKHKGGWWYHECHSINLNGLYFSATDKPNSTCTNWYHFKNDYRCMKNSEMKLRPGYFGELPL